MENKSLELQSILLGFCICFQAIVKFENCQKLNHNRLKMLKENMQIKASFWKKCIIYLIEFRKKINRGKAYI